MGDYAPYFIKAFLPFGPLIFKFDREQGKFVDTYPDHRENIGNKSGERAPTTALIDPAYSFISAILHSGVNWIIHPPILGEDFSILHNPIAAHPLIPPFFIGASKCSTKMANLNVEPNRH